MAGFNPANLDDASVGIGNKSSATSIQILADLTGNKDTDDPNEDITYKYYDDPDFQIKRKGSTSDSFQPLAENITEFTVLYFNATGPPDIGTSTLTDIKQIQITITGRTDRPDPNLDRVDGPSAFGYRYGTLTTHVTPENLDF
jgi:hypothetical protein